MEYLDELLKLHAILEELLDKEVKIITNDIMPGFIKDIRLKVLSNKEEIIRYKLVGLEQKATESYNQKIKSLNKKVVGGVRVR